MSDTPIITALESVIKSSKAYHKQRKIANTEEDKADALSDKHETLKYKLEKFVDDDSEKFVLIGNVTWKLSKNRSGFFDYEKVLFEEEKV